MAERKFYAKGPLMLYASLCLVVLMNALDVCMLVAQQLYYDYFNSTSIELGNVAKRCARCVLVQLFRPFFATSDFEPNKDQVTRPNWIRRDRCVTSCDNCAAMWQVVTSEWSFEETHTNAPRRPPDTRMEVVCVVWPETLLYNNHRLRSLQAFH